MAGIAGPNTGPSAHGGVDDCIVSTWWVWMGLAVQVSVACATRWLRHDKMGPGGAVHDTFHRKAKREILYKRKYQNLKTKKSSNTTARADRITGSPPRRECRRILSIHSPQRPLQPRLLATDHRCPPPSQSLKQNLQRPELARRGESKQRFLSAAPRNDGSAKR